MQWYSGIILVVLGILLYVLYERGYLPVKSMSSIHFIGNMGAGTSKASAAFGSATGQIRKAFSGIYKKATIKVPKKQLKTYKKFLLKKGVTKSAKIKK